MHNDWETIGLEDLGIVRTRGADAVRFLQGQLSNDVARLCAGRSLLAGYHNPQGRTIALLRLVQFDADDVLAVVPRELAPVVTSRLLKFVLRAKVKITDESESWRVSGLVAAPTSAALPSTRHAQMRVDASVFVRVADDPPRWILISPADGSSVDGGIADRPQPVTDSAPGDRATWRRLDVACGQPQVYVATSEEFVAQMLNLDVLDAIAFDKGCYTGQEVIARAHYRGRVKRRLQRFVSREPCQLRPGEAGLLADGRAFKVVEAAQLADGRCDFLAVAPVVSGEREATVEAAAANADADPAAGASIPTLHGQAFQADQLPLPYFLPD